MRYPSAFALIAYIVGIFCSDMLFSRGVTLPAGLLLLAAAMAVVAMILVYQRYNRSMSKWIVSCLALTFFLAGAARLVLNREGEQVEWPAERAWRIVVADAPKETDRAWSFTGRIVGTEFDGLEVKWHLAKAQPTDSIEKNIQHIDKSAQQQARDTIRIQAGDELLCYARIKPLSDKPTWRDFDFDNYLRRKGIKGTAHCFSGTWKSMGQSSRATLSERALRLRDKLTAQAKAHLSGEELAVFSAITLGDKSLLEQSTRQIYSQSGVSHVLALSGLHLGILFAIYQMLAHYILRPWFRYRILISVVGVAILWTFAFVAGFPISLVRAATMFSIMQLSLAIRMDGDGIDSLCFAAFIILTASPQALFDIGFQLSCISVLSILLFSPLFHAHYTKETKRKRFRWWCMEMAFVSFVAQIATFPLVAYCFHNVQLYGIISNFFAVPAAYALLSLGLAFFVLPFLQIIIAPVIQILLWLLNHILGFIASWPGNDWHIYPTALTTFLIYAAIILFVLPYFDRERNPWSRRRFRTGALIAAVLAVVSQATWRFNERQQPGVVFYDFYSSTPVHFIASGQESYLWTNEGTAEEGRNRLANLKKDFWQPRNMPAPTLFTDSLHSSKLLSNGEVTLFANLRIARLNTHFTSKAPRTPFPVDALLVERGCSMYLRTILRRYQPKLVVLSAALPEKKRMRYIHEADSLGIAIHDMESEGLLRLDNVAVEKE